MATEYACYPYEGNIELFLVGEDLTNDLENQGMEDQDNLMGAFVEGNPEFASYIPMVNGLESE